MENYILIKDLPDAKQGTVLYWSEVDNKFTYCDLNGVIKSLTKEQVITNNHFFIAANKYPEYYAWNNPVYSRKELHALFKEIFYARYITDQFGNKTSGSIELNHLDTSLRILGKMNAEKILNSK